MSGTNDIEPGTLELFAMSALPADEMAEMERRIANDPELAREVAEIRDSIAAMDRHHERTPRRHIRGAILTTIDGEPDTVARSKGPNEARVRTSAERERALRLGEDTMPVPEPFRYGSSPKSTPADASTTSTEPAHPPKIIFPDATHRSESIDDDARPSSSRYLMAASWIIAVIGVGAATYFGMRLRDAENTVDALQREMSVMTSRNDDLSKSLDIARAPGTHMVTVAGMKDKAPGARALVYWNPSSKKIYLAANELPPPPEGKQYQLWAIKGDAKIDAGMIPMEPMTGGMMQLNREIADAEAFAITLERKGGSPQPDLTNIYAMGTVAPAG